MRYVHALIALIQLLAHRRRLELEFEYALEAGEDLLGPNLAALDRSIEAVEAQLRARGWRALGSGRPTAERCASCEYNGTPHTGWSHR